MTVLPFIPPRDAADALEAAVADLQRVTRAVAGLAGTIRGGRAQPLRESRGPRRDVLLSLPASLVTRLDAEASRRGEARSMIVAEALETLLDSDDAA